MTEAVSPIEPGSVDESLWPGPDYSPTVFDGAFPHGNQARPHDFYHSVMGPWYEYKIRSVGDTSIGYDWVMIKDVPEEVSW